MENFDIKNLGLFIILFFPGFLMIKVYHLIVADEKYDFSKNLMEIVGFSILNLLLNSWLIYLSIHNDWLFEENYKHYISLIWILIIAPCVYPWLWKKLSETDFFKDHTLGLDKTAWDHFFKHRSPEWVIVNLKDGKRIGGCFQAGSFASNFPQKESLYIKNLYSVDEKNKFTEVPNNNGMLILGDNIATIEFLKGE